MAAPLRPSHRERNRYVAVELDADTPLTRSAVGRALGDTYLGLYGASGAADAGLWLMDWEGNRGVVKLTHRSVDDFRRALATVAQVGGVPVRPRTVSVSGTLRAVRERLGLPRPPRPKAPRAGKRQSNGKPPSRTGGSRRPKQPSSKR